MTIRRQCATRSCRAWFKTEAVNGIAKSRKCPKCVRMALLHRRNRHGKGRERRGGTFPAFNDLVRREALREACEVCGEKYTMQFYPRQSIDHIIPRRLVTTWGMEPDVAVNLLSCHGRCHSRKSGAENRMFKGDWLSAAQILKRLGWPLDRVAAAAEHFGFTAFARLLK